MWSSFLGVRWIPKVASFRKRRSFYPNATFYPSDSFETPIDMNVDGEPRDVLRRRSAASDLARTEDVDVVVYNKYIETSVNGSLPSPTPVRVDVSVVFLKIGEIDTLKEQYEADVLIKARWREPLLDRGKSNEPQGSVDLLQYWNPKLFIENTIGDPKEHAFQMLTYNANGEATIIEKRRVKGVFLENLELKDFPFDVQDLTVTVMSEKSTEEIELVEDPSDMHRVNKQSFVDEQEWQLYKCIDTELKEVSNEHADPTVKRWALLVKCRASRRPAYFFWNIFLITFLITSLAFATFSVDRNLPQNRLQLSFTLVLTSVAFKFVVNQSLPKISYLTYLDKYVLAAMILLTAVCVWHAVTSVILSAIGDTIETIALVFFLGTYFLFNLIFVVRIYMLPGSKRREMEKKERQYLELVHQQMAKKQNLTQSQILGALGANSHHVTAI